MNALSETKPLRPFQAEAIQRLTETLNADCNSVCFVAPTGAGKTRCAVEFVTNVKEQGKRVILFAHRTELIDQLSQTLDDAAIDHGVIKAKHPRNRPELPIQVASVQTLHQRLHRAPEADILIFDECHRTMAASYLKIIAAYPNAQVVGFTATPRRLDNRGLREVYKSMVVAATAPQLIEWGFLVNPAVFAPAQPGMPGWDRDFARKVDANRLRGDVLEHWRRISPGQRTIVFASTVAHSKAICEHFTEAGVPAEHVDGKTPEPVRRAIFERLRTGETLVVCNVNIATEGLDIPELATVVLAMATESETRYLQAVGRVMRPAAGKEKAYVIDHGGNVHLHGLPSSHRVYSLNDGLPDEVPHLKACRKCKAMLPRGEMRCGVCGYQYPSPARSPLPTVDDAAKLVLVDGANSDAKTPPAANRDAEVPTTPCPKCGSPTREHRDVARFGHFGIQVICTALCRYSWFRTDHAGFLNATQEQHDHELSRFECIARRKGKNAGWAAWMVNRMQREAEKHCGMKELAQ